MKKIYLFFICNFIIYNVSSQEIKRFIIGTYTNNNDSKGIYLIEIDFINKKSKILNTFETINPSFLTLNLDKTKIFVANEIDNFEKKSSGFISVLNLNNNNFEMKFMTSSLGANPCHIIFNSLTNNVLVGNYTGGNFSVFKYLNDELKHIQTINHKGKSVNIDRQEAPHVHSVNLSKDMKSIYVIDLGIDQILKYDLDKKNEKYNENPSQIIKLLPGSGPRHFTLHPTQNLAYVINELNSTITYYFVEANNNLKEIGTFSTLNLGDNGINNFCADIHIHPNGKYLYASNRGRNTISIFDIFNNNEPLQFISTNGDWPRNFMITNDGKYLIVANQKSNELTLFSIDETTGKLKLINYKVTIPSPVVIVEL